jgi:hypothetical protein
MQLDQFLQYNKFCPACGRELTLYMQWIDSICFRNTDNNNENYCLQPFKCLPPSRESEAIKSECVILRATNHFDMEFSENWLFDEAKRYQIYFFFLCDERGFEQMSSNDYYINLQHACYYRSTPVMELQSPHWKLETILAESHDIANKDESFCVTERAQNSEKVYMINIDHERQDTTLWYYTFPDSERNNDQFDPVLFEKYGLPYIQTPDLSPNNRQNLLNKINTWLTFS